MITIGNNPFVQCGPAVLVTVTQAPAVAPPPPAPVAPPPPAPVAPPPPAPVAPPPPPQTITIVSASYGLDVSSSAYNNLTGLVASLCNGKTSCSFAPWYTWTNADPFPGDVKTFDLDYQCGDTLMPHIGNGYPSTPSGPYTEAGYITVDLSCP